MFRSPKDESSSESESDTSDEEIGVSRISTNKSTTPETSTSSSQHESLITASLLEFHYTVRAAELLNAAAWPRGHGGPQTTTNQTAGNVANQGPPRYDRHSPEAKALAKKMFANGSELLASHGMLAEDLHSDELQNARQSYLTGIDSLGLGALSDAGALPPTTRLALEAPEAISDPMSCLKIDPLTRQRDIFLSQINQIALPSPMSDMQLSRYATDFTEVRQLGRGGFGTVYHVINLVDRQHYAIKKIGLDARRLKKKWQEGGQEEAETVLREIRTLASLEHSNIVRYFGAWIERPTSSSAPSDLQGSRLPIFRRLLGNRSAEASTGVNSVSESGGIVFGENSVSQESVNEVIEGKATSTITSGDESDVFTDGDGRGGRPTPPSPNQITLCLQMSLHQLNLARYLSPTPSTVSSPDYLHDSVHNRHCFHLKPSLNIFLGILTGVQYLHSAGIVHRDLKPANIFLSEDSTLRPGFVDASCFACSQQYSRYLNARIGDFGLVGNSAEELSAAAYASGKVVGTELYRPPRPQIPTPSSSHEDAKGKGLAKPVDTATRLDEKIDVFALGVLLFELLWRFDTKTERFVVLNALTKSGTLPTGFGDMFGRPPGVDTADRRLKHQTSGSGGMIAECIAGMVHNDPAERWDCARVKGVR